MADLLAISAISRWNRFRAEYDCYPDLCPRSWSRESGYTDKRSLASISSISNTRDPVEGEHASNNRHGLRGVSLAPPDLTPHPDSAPTACNNAELETNGEALVTRRARHMAPSRRGQPCESRPEASQVFAAETAVSLSHFFKTLCIVSSRHLDLWRLEAGIAPPHRPGAKLRWGAYVLPHDFPGAKMDDEMCAGFSSRWPKAAAGARTIRILLPPFPSAHRAVPAAWGDGTRRCLDRAPHQHPNHAAPDSGRRLRGCSSFGVSPNPNTRVAEISGRAW
ncbi:hypothetical protein JHW43_008837 [Diplocarpon mali]|nr:hypothetical protein JHW43_008837 [Diplocarpon mali]